MGILNWLLGKPKPRVAKWRGRPLYRIGNRTYWKGRPTDDDDFESVRRDKDELRQYNYWVRRLNRRLRNKRRSKIRQRRKLRRR